jgi:hypothetical protein
MLLNITSRYSVKARENEYGGIFSNVNYGPSFGYGELYTNEPLLGERNVQSEVG